MKKKLAQFQSIKLMKLMNTAQVECMKKVHLSMIQFLVTKHLRGNFMIFMFHTVAAAILAVVARVVQLHVAAHATPITPTVKLVTITQVATMWMVGDAGRVPRDNTSQIAVMTIASAVPR